MDVERDRPRIKYITTIYIYKNINIYNINIEGYSAVNKSIYRQVGREIIY
jgi:hypothetical protein